MGNPLRRLICLAALVCLSLAGRAADSLEWPTLAFTPVATNRFAKPTCIAAADDGSGRLFVAEQGGKVWIVKNGQVATTPFLDLSTKVTTAGPEQGLLGLVFPPDFQSKQYFYVYYTAPWPNLDRPTWCTIVISRFRISVDLNIAGPRTEEVIMTMDKDLDYHNGGQLVFGPDGFLYIGVGDGGPHFDQHKRGQDLTSRFGKILRIDVESGIAPYSVPANNPFVSKTNALPEIWAYGLRNPWRFAFDRSTRDLFIGDVGENAFEEVDFQPAASLGGENYGWRVMEGPEKLWIPPVLDDGSVFTNFASLTPPIFSYDHYSMGGDGGQGSVTGGYVYRGPNPKRLDGMYLCADFMAGYIWGIKRDGDQWRTNALRIPIDAPRYWVSTFGEDAQGRLYMADYYTGDVYEVIDSGQVWAPDFSPRNGAIPTDKVRITSATSGAEIHYTTDGTDPLPGNPVVPADGLVSVPDGATLKARAFRNDLLPSDIRASKFFYRPGAPIFSPPGGPVLSNTVVSISSETPGTKFYYTVNGYPPQIDDTNTFLYTGPILINGSAFIQAVAVLDGFGAIGESDVSYSGYGIKRVERPWFDPINVRITNGTFITITCATPGAIIHYAVNPGATTQNRIYTQPFKINGNDRIVAYATADGQAQSDYLDVTYDLAKTATPIFSEPPYGFLPDEVTITCATPGATVHYSFGGSGVSSSSPVYSGPIKLSDDVIIQAMATSAGNPDSDVQTIAYSKPQLYWADFDPPESSLLIGQSIRILSPNIRPDVLVHYTLDGSDPDENAAKYTEPIVFNGTPMTIRAAAFSPNFHSSYPNYVKSAYYGVLTRENTFVSTFAGSTNVTSFGPTGICIDGAGTLYVVDTLANRVITIPKSGPGNSFYVGNDTSYPTTIAVDAQQNVYVADNLRSSRILKYTLQGGMSVFATVSDRSGLGGMCFGPDGSLYFGFLKSLRKLTPDGTMITLADVTTNAFTGGVAPYVDQATNIFWIRDNLVWLTKPDGTTELYAGGFNPNGDGDRLTAGFSGLESIASDGAGGLILCEPTRVRRLKDGFVTTLAGNGGGYRNGPGAIAGIAPYSACADADGNIYVTDGIFHCIRKISRDSAGVGLPDDWQQANFGMIGINPEADADADGVSNRVEFWSGTNPNDATSALTLDRSLPSDANGSLRLRWPTIRGKRYQLEFSLDLENWVKFGAEMVGDGGPVEVKDATIRDPRAHWFYRVVVLDL